ncbi:hypothetical protein W822_21750 [Advenella kashmirensis W13003]|uniref:TadE-like domain-containing protein n=1 Tax=Advenella kashmirensis W13003 TaxID=1424334 RepID=V8QNJ4_9BURK|nr:TadE/TadG family type IV pilus assembly protein [Advenella kashmirensis]ETF00544.1 hypothetical protein W822_21750 [Advenella kashmirensis W13003]
MTRRGKPRHADRALLRRQRGVGTIEFLVAAVPLLFSAMATFEASRWYMTREAVNLALLEAARAGSVAHARPQAIENAFLNGLTPLFASAGQGRNPQARMMFELDQFEQTSGGLAWDITILHPSAAEFADFMQKDLPIALTTGLPAINNHYQFRQHQQHGKGQLSGSTIYDANTLQLQVRYLYQPVVPGMRTLLRSVFSATGLANSAAATQGALPIVSAIAIEMQSHPVFWQSGETRHVHYAQRAGLAANRPAAPPHTPQKPQTSGVHNRTEPAGQTSGAKPSVSTAASDASNASAPEVASRNGAGIQGAPEDLLINESACRP